jgi:RNA polymerase sigma-70 factor (ECF subfamily)
MTPRRRPRPRPAATGDPAGPPPAAALPGGGPAHPGAPAPEDPPATTNPPPEAAEEALIASSRSGDAGAQDALVRRYQDRVYGFAMRMCRNVEDAKDILQETFLGMIRALPDFRGDSRFTTWLYRIASNACLKKRRRGVFEPEPAQVLSLDALMPRPDAEGRKPEIPDWSQDAERALLRGELAQHLETAIDALPREYKIVLLLRDVEGFSAEETAEMLQLSVPAVKSRLHRARVAVRDHLGN